MQNRAIVYVWGHIISSKPSETYTRKYTNPSVFQILILLAFSEI